MMDNEKERLMQLLADSQSTTRDLIQGLDPDKRVHPPDGWRIREVIGHLAAWDHETAKSLRAYHDGSEYAIPDFDEDAFNQDAISQQADLSSSQIEHEWEAARQDFIAAVAEIPQDLFPGDLLYPWGDERGSIAQLVRYMVEHDQEHRQEISETSKPHNK
jgi:hypothetical protein